MGGNKAGTNKLGKYLLILGGLGVAILAFVMLAKKFNPFKKVQDFLADAGQNVSKWFGSAGTNVTNLFKSSGQKAKELLDKTSKNIQQETAENRRKLRRYAKEGVRKLEAVKKNTSSEVAQRAETIKKAFKKVKTIKTPQVAKLFSDTIRRQAEINKKNKKKKGGKK